MVGNHVRRKLSAYCHDELTAEESRRVGEHLMRCNRCRVEFEEIKLGVRLAEQLPRFSPPDSLWEDLEPLLTAGNGVGAASNKPVFRFWQPRFAAIAAVLLLATALVAFLVLRLNSLPSWEVASLDGAPRIGSIVVSGKGRLKVGQWLETDSSSRAQIAVGSIGQVEIDPNTRVRLLQTKPLEHRLELARGRMSARIWAPPRLFFVDTPSAVAADLGCAYTLEVDDQGASLLHVTSGWVALQLKDRQSMVPAGAACKTRLGTGPGTPYFEDASETFRAALYRVDFERNPVASGNMTPLEIVVGNARMRDTLTLWHLLSRVYNSDRALVFDRMAALVPPPNGVTREGVLALDQQMLDLWKQALESHWNLPSTPTLIKTWKKLWTRGLGKINGLEGKK